MRVLSQVQVLKVAVPDAGFKPFAPQGEALSFSSLIVRHHTRGWKRLCLSLSYPLRCGFPLTSLMCRICSASFQGFFSEEIAPYVAVDSVSLGGGELRIFLCHHLEVEPSPTHAFLHVPSLPDSNTWNVHPTSYSPQLSIILTYFLFEDFPTFSGQ